MQLGKYLQDKSFDRLVEWWFTSIHILEQYSIGSNGMVLNSCGNNMLPCCVFEAVALYNSVIAFSPARSKDNLLTRVFKQVATHSLASLRIFFAWRPWEWRLEGFRNWFPSFLSSPWLLWALRGVVAALSKITPSPYFLWYAKSGLTGFTLLDTNKEHLQSIPLQ